jgi:hypothetical protein
MAVGGGVVLARAPEIERFVVEAAVGGVVRSNLRDLGRAIVEHSPPGERPMRIRARAQVRDPEKNKLYRFAIDMAYGLALRRLTVIESRNRFNTDAAQFRINVERVAPFVHLVRILPVPGPADEPSRTFIAPHGYFVLRYRRTESGVEASLHQDDELVARFGLSERSNRPCEIEWFTIPSTAEVTISFRRFHERDGFGRLTPGTF